ARGQGARRQVDLPCVRGVARRRGQVGRGYDLQRPGARLGGGGQVHHLPEHVNDRELHDLDESRAERPVVVLRLKSGGDRGQRVEAGVVPAVARRRVDVGADRVRDRIGRLDQVGDGDLRDRGGQRLGKGE